MQSSGESSQRWPPPWNRAKGHDSLCATIGHNIRHIVSGQSVALTTDGWTSVFEYNGLKTQKNHDDPTWYRGHDQGRMTNSCESTHIYLRVASLFLPGGGGGWWWLCIRGQTYHSVVTSAKQLTGENDESYSHFLLPAQTVCYVLRGESADVGHKRLIPLGCVPLGPCSSQAGMRLAREAQYTHNLSCSQSIPAASSGACSID